jgi:spore maturation protein CgeB
MFVLLAVMAQSPYNRSIWMGLGRGFQANGCRVEVVPGERLPDPAALSARPDLLFAVHGRNVPPELVARYRAAGIPTAVYLLDEPYEVDLSTTWARTYEWVFTVDRATVSVHAQYSRAHHLPLGYDDAIFHPGVPVIGSEILVLGSPFRAREDFLAPVIKDFGPRITWVGPGWRELSSGLGHHNEGFVPPEGCAAYYRGAKIVINIHRDSVWSHFGEHNCARIEATHLNPRFWEAAACGVFQLVSWRADLELYAPDSAHFRTAAELVTQIGEYLENQSERAVRAGSVLSRITSHHYGIRAAEVIKLVAAT